MALEAATRRRRPIDLDRRRRANSPRRTAVTAKAKSWSPTRGSLQDTINQVGQELTRRNLNVQPTLTVRPGFPVRVIVNKDLVLQTVSAAILRENSAMSAKLRLGPIPEDRDGEAYDYPVDDS